MFKFIVIFILVVAGITNAAPAAQLGLQYPFGGYPYPAQPGFGLGGIPLLGNQYPGFGLGAGGLLPGYGFGWNTPNGGFGIYSW